MRARAAMIPLFIVASLAVGGTVVSTRVDARAALTLNDPGTPNQQGTLDHQSGQAAASQAPAQAASAQAASGQGPASAPAEAPQASSEVPAATLLTGIEVGSNADGVTVTLRGNGRLSYGAMQEADRPPLRLVIDFPGVRPSIAAATQGRGPLRRVRVALNNVSPLVTRVVFDLARNVSHRVRPSADGREVVFTLQGGDDSVETPAADTPTPAAAAATATGTPGARGATRLTGLSVSQGPEGVTITLKGNGQLTPRPIEQAKDAPPRLVLDLPGVRSAVAASTAVEKGVVERVRVALNSRQPVVTRVIVHMKSRFLYRMRPNASDGRELTITVADPQTTTEPGADFVLSEIVNGAPSTRPDAPTRTETTRAPETPSATPLTVGGRQFTGHAIGLDFQGVDLRAVLRTFAEITGLNIVIDPGVTGTVDVSLHEVPWDQALDTILRTNQLGYTVEGSIVRIAPLKVLADEEVARRRLAEEQALSGEIKTYTKVLSYANAKDLTDLLTKSALTKRGTVQVDDRTNTVILTDLDEGLTAARGLIDTLDTAQPQVSIEARIVETSSSFSRELGLLLGLRGESSTRLANTLPLAFPNNGTIDSRSGAINNEADLIKMTLGSINGALKLDAQLSALETEGKVRILSLPSVVTQNNVEAEMTQGTQIPYTTATQQPGGDGGLITTFVQPTVQFKDAALTLTVKPRITASNTVIMDVVLERSAPDYTNVIPGNPNPAISTQRAKTTLQVTDGVTTVIGGVRFEQERNNDDRTPLLHKLPVVGRLFKRYNRNSETRELMLFITPKIIKS